jgi:DNA-binding winged helix-turn-helix (wHTH) protein
VPLGDSAAGPKLLSWPRPPGSAEPGQDPAGAEPVALWDEQVPPPGRDATLLAVVPIPGTSTSLAIVGYVIATSANQPSAEPPQPDQPSAEPPQPDQAEQAAYAGQTGLPDRAGPASREGCEPPAAAKNPGSGLRLDHIQRRVWADGREVQLTFQEFELLAFLAAHPSRVFTRADLVGQVWHRDLGHDGRLVPGDSRTVDVHVSRLRHKLGPRHGQCLVAEYRVGYQFRPLPPQHVNRHHP